MAIYVLVLLCIMTTSNLIQVGAAAKDNDKKGWETIVMIVFVIAYIIGIIFQAQSL